MELHSVLPDLVPLSVSAEESGMDFYAARCPVMIDGAVAGYVLAGGRSAQHANTVHFNLFGKKSMAAASNIMHILRLIMFHGIQREKLNDHLKANF